MQPQRLVNVDIEERRARAAQTMRFLQYVPRNQPSVGCSMPMPVPEGDGGSGGCTAAADGEYSDELPDPFADDDPNPELTEMRKVRAQCGHILETD